MRQITEKEVNMPEDDERADEDVIDEDEAELAPLTPTWSEDSRGNQSIFVDTGRGGTMEVTAGSPFVPTLERLSEELHYGGYYRIFLNGSEVVNPADSPPTIEQGMRIAITSYDKVG